MKRFLLSIFLFVGVVSFGFGQTTYFSIPAGGNWNSAATWDIGDDFTGGDGIPGPNDVAVILGDGAGGGNVLLTANQTVGDVYVQYDNPNVLSKGGFFLSTFTLTINGQLAGVDFLGAGAFVEPTTSVIQTNQRLNLVFTGANLGSTSFNPVITSWGNGSPLRNVTFNGATGGTNMEVENFNLFGGSTLNLTNGILTVLAGNSISQASNASISTSSGTNLIVNGSITGDGSPSSRINNINIQGNVTTGTAGYVNAENFTLGATSTFTINFNDILNQTQGWWYQNAGPTGTFSLDPSSTVIYNASANQVVGAQEYGNLRLRSQSGASVKSLQSSGNLLVQGLLRLNSGNVTFDTSPNSNPIEIEGNVENLGNFSPTQRVIFSGSTPQSINGANQITFAGGLRVSNTAGLTLNNIGIDINGELDVDPSCSFNPSDQVVTVLGDMRIDGTLMAGTNPGGFVFDGTTEFLGSGTRGFFDVTIDAVASVIAPNGTLTVHRNWANNGTFNNNQGTVRFTDTPTKLISGTSTTSFWNLAAEGGTINVNGTVDLENVMTFAGNPTIDFDGSADNGTFTVKSTAARDAAIANIGSATIQGNAVVERYITGGTGESSYHYMGSPIATDIADWQQEFYVTGGFSDPSSGPGINSNTPSIYVYDELSAGGLNDKWVSYPTTSSAAPIEVGRGYAVSLRDEQGTITANTIGEFHTGQATWNVTDQGGPDDGWNLIANQFPSAIDFDAVGWNKANIENGFYVYDPASGDNLYYSDGVSAATDQYIALGQAFWVRATSNGTVTAQETVKYTGGTPAFYREKSLEKIKIIFEGDEHRDDSYVMFNPEATDAYDPRHDFSNLRNDDHNISTLSTDSKDLKVNHMASLNAESDCGKSIPLFVRASSTGHFSLKFEELSSIQMSESISLIDHFTDDVINISEGSIYEFDITDDAASKGANRFELSFETKVPVNVESIAMDVCPNDNGTVLLKSTEAFATYLIYKNDGIVSIADGNGGNLEIEIDKEHLSDNLNEFTLKSFIGGCDTVSVGSAQIKVNEALRLNNEVLGSTICKVESRASFSIATQINANYYILQNQDTLESFTGTGNQFDGFISANNLKNGTNEFVVAVEKDACQSGTLKDKLKIIVENLTIDQDIEFTASNVCIENPTTINFLSQDKVEYQFYKKEELVATGLGEGTDESIEIPTEFLSVGLNEFNVVAKHGECGEYAFENKIEINVEDSINADLNIVTNNICGVQEVTVIIENAQEEKTYSLLKADQSIMSNTASKDGALTFTLDSSNFELGVNQFDILIEGQNCESVKAFQRVEFGNYNSAVIEEIETQSVCLNESVTIDLAANLPMSVYQVFIGDELIMDETGSSIVLSPTETTTYTITGEPESGCESNSINFTVEVTDLAKPGILVSGKVLESSIEGETYQWYLDGDLVADETGKVIVAEKTGNYAVEVSKSNCSILSDTFTFNDEVLSANKELETALKLYPNPVIEKMFVEFDNFSAVEVTIFTLSGKFIDGFRLDSSQSEIDMSKFSKGTYLIQFESEKGSVTKRVIKQ
ncbi:Por secretion system C-terminal sorting domain-containing protein [Marivirga sericea]|uniref:Por secretion system C-terminal sorting domain-containing protein n=1 Tax=Marivirga sericea TaxID=1028 RepID=A0A1X7K980_9BACT|nr:T9SS type A sorting domain-containing protein [Marivirga sericea]SMG37503.1 Por secretion system C-terminal sorting domain-containing protein [Marivirga sericea]